MNPNSIQPKLTTTWATPRSGFTVLELLVSVAIVSILMALLFSSLGAVRESTRRVQCTSHLREIALALHAHHDAKQALPVGWQFDPDGHSAFGWAVSLLPYLELADLSTRIDPKKHLVESCGQEIRSTSLEIMLCPSDITDPTFTLFEESESEHEAAGVFALSIPEPLVQLPTANYVGMFGTLEPDDTIPAPRGDGAFLENRQVRFRDFTRGLSHTIVIGERTMAQVPSTWLGVELAGEDAAARLVGSALEGINNPLADECDFSSRHAGGANFVWGDGHVSFVMDDIDLNLYHQYAKLRD